MSTKKSPPKKNGNLRSRTVMDENALLCEDRLDRIEKMLAENAIASRKQDDRIAAQIDRIAAVDDRIAAANDRIAAANDRIARSDEHFNQVFAEQNDRFAEQNDRIAEYSKYIAELLKSNQEQIAKLGNAIMTIIVNNSGDR